MQSPMADKSAGTQRGTSTCYNTSQRAAAQWQHQYARRCARTAEASTAERVRKLEDEVGAIKRLVTGEQIP
jgi:hypothetical protein